MTKVRLDNILFLTGFIFLTFTDASAQLEASNWISSWGKNWKFTDSGIVCFSGYETSPKTHHNAACISDPAGNLVLYTNGRNVYNSYEEVIENGNNIGGYSNFEYYGVPMIIPNPSNNGIYYLFSPLNHANRDVDKLSLSVVDMNTNSGKGKVIVTNRQLNNYCRSQLAAVHHHNGEDVWVISAGSRNSIYAYLVTKNGLAENPVVTSLDFDLNDTLEPDPVSWTILKAAPDGKHLVLKLCYIDYHVPGVLTWLILFDFNDWNGKLSNPRVLYFHDNENKNKAPVHFEFSPDGRLLYFFWWNGTVPVSSRINISLEDSALIRQSEYQEINRIIGDQLGIDGILYGNTLDILINPNEEKPFCFVNPACYYPSTPSLFISSYFYKPTISSGIIVTDPCEGRQTAFVYYGPYESDSLLWNFDDPTSGSADRSGQNPALHQYTSFGSYNPVLTRYFDSLSCKVTTSVVISPQTISEADTTTCANKALRLSSGKYANQTGDYRDTLVNWYGCDSIVTYHVIVKPAPETELGKDWNVCLKDTTIILDAGEQDAVKWYPGNETGRYLEISEEGTYRVLVSNTYDYSAEDSVVVSDQCPFVLLVPTAFSPNKDGLNDLFRVVCSEDMSVYTIRVYNRWGQELYAGHDPGTGWDGTHKGEPCPTGAYAYVITAKNESGKNIIKAGTVTLIR